MTPPPIGELLWFDLPGMRRQLDDYRCDCGTEGAEIVAVPAAEPHYAEVRCRAGHFVQWAAGPKTAEARKQTRRGKRRPRADEDYCDICLRTRGSLPEHVTLEVRHRIDRATLIDADELPDEEENLGWICSTPCKGIEIALRAGFDHYQVADG